MVFLFHCRLTPVGDPPSPRAAHAATAVGTMVVIQVLHLHSLTKFQLNHCWGGTNCSNFRRLICIESWHWWCADGVCEGGTHRGV